MRQSDIVAALRAAGYPVAFARFKKKPALPYVLLLASGTGNTFADDRVYSKARRWRVWLVSEDKDLAAEQGVEAALDAAGICWEIVDEFPVDEEETYQVIYEFEEAEE